MYATSQDYAQENIEMPYNDAKKMMREHCIEWSDLVEEFGEKELYNTKEVLSWLGY